MVSALEPPHTGHVTERAEATVISVSKNSHNNQTFVRRRDQNRGSSEILRFLRDPEVPEPTSGGQKERYRKGLRYAAGPV